MAVSWRRLCHAMMAVNPILMVTTLTVAAVWYTQAPAQPSSCLQGLPPSTAESDIKNLTWKTMQQAVEEKHNNYQAAELFRTMTPQGQKSFAHVVLESSQSFTRDKNLLWNTSHPESKLQGFQYDPRGYLHVPENGLYFVYAHLHYMDRTHLGTHLGFDRDRLKDYIFRNEKRFVDDPTMCDRMKRKLLFNEQTPCKAVGGTTLVSSYQGAVMELRHDDMLSVASALPENLIKDSQSYFGMYLV